MELQYLFRSDRFFRGCTDRKGFGVTVVGFFSTACQQKGAPGLVPILALPACLANRENPTLFPRVFSLGPARNLKINLFGNVVGVISGSMRYGDAPQERVYQIMTRLAKHIGRQKGTRRGTSGKSLYVFYTNRSLSCNHVVLVVYNVDNALRVI